MSNVVRFELPAYADADAFCARIRSRWAGTRRLDGDVRWYIMDEPRQVVAS